VNKESELRVFFGKVFKQPLGVVWKIADAITVGVVARVVAPVVALAVRRPEVADQLSATVYRDLALVFYEAVTRVLVPLHGRHQTNADVVDSENVVLKHQPGVDLAWGVVDGRPYPVVCEQVSGDHGIIQVLHSDAISARAAVRFGDVVTHVQSTAVHEERTDRVMGENVVFHDGVVVVHEVESVAAFGDLVAAYDKSL
jgi:hypothetical protein